MRAVSLPVIFLLLVLLCAQVGVAAPAAPVIDAAAPDCVLPMELEPPLLSVDAHSPDGGELEYQWYSALVSDGSDASAVSGAVFREYTPPVLPGTAYYRAAVWSVSGGARSEAAYSRWIAVTFTFPVTTVEILRLPNKLEYLAGESPDLTGLCVRIQHDDLTFEDADGAHLEYSKEPLTIGTQEIVLRYGDAAASFFVTVRTEEHHVHTYPDGWTVVREAGCEETGERTRVCPCGAIEHEVIPAAGHIWNAGSAVKQGTRYVCTVCGSSYTQARKAPSKRPASSAQASRNTESAAVSSIPQPKFSEEPQAQRASSRQPSDSISEVQMQHVILRQRDPWKLIAIAAAVLAFCALLAFFLTRRKKEGHSS